MPLLALLLLLLSLPSPLNALDAAANFKGQDKRSISGDAVVVVVGCPVSRRLLSQHTVPASQSRTFGMRTAGLLQTPVSIDGRQMPGQLLGGRESDSFVGSMATPSPLGGELFEMQHCPPLEHVTLESTLSHRSVSNPIMHDPGQSPSLPVSSST